MGDAAIEVHLPEPILGHGIPEAEKEIVGCLGPDERDPSTIPGDRYWPGDPYNRLSPLSLRTEEGWEGGENR